MLHNKLWKTCFAILLLSTVLSSQSVLTAEAEPEPITLLYADEWSATYVNANNVYAADVDGDGVVEIITVGVIQNTLVQGQLKISTWGPSYNIEVDELFTVDGMYTMAYDVTVGDLDGDDTLEIVVVGTAWDSENKYYAWIRVYSWDNTTLTLEDTYVRSGNDAEYVSVVVGDLDGDGIHDIFAGGRTNASPPRPCIDWLRFSMEGGIELIDFTSWFYPGADYQLLTDIEVRNDTYVNWDIAAVSSIMYGGETIGELSIFNVDTHALKIEQTDTVTITGEGDTGPHSVSSHNQLLAVAGGAYSSAGLGRGGVWWYSPYLTLQASEVFPSGEEGVSLWWNWVGWEKLDGDLVTILVGATGNGGTFKVIDVDLNESTGEPINYTGNWWTKDHSFGEPGTVLNGGYIADLNDDGEKELVVVGNNDFLDSFTHLYGFYVPMDTTISANILDEIPLNNPFNVHGSITEPVAGVTVTLLYISPTGFYSTTQTVTTDSEGKYNDAYHPYLDPNTWQPDLVGEWRVTASWPGDDTHNGATSLPAYFDVTKIPTTFYASASPLTIGAEDSVTISVDTDPALPDKDLSFTWKKPDGSIYIINTVKTDGDGSVIEEFKPTDEGGQWTVDIEWFGDVIYMSALTTVSFTLDMNSFFSILIIVAVVIAVLIILAFALHKLWGKEDHDDWSKKIRNDAVEQDRGIIKVPWGDTVQEVIDMINQRFSLDAGMDFTIRWWKRGGRLQYVLQYEGYEDSSHVRKKIEFGQDGEEYGKDKDGKSLDGKPFDAGKAVRKRVP